MRRYISKRAACVLHASFSAVFAVPFPGSHAGAPPLPSPEYLVRTAHLPVVYTYDSMCDNMSWICCQLQGRFRTKRILLAVVPVVC